VFEVFDFAFRHELPGAIEAELIEAVILSYCATVGVRNLKSFLIILP
jgi:hypothetical protein